MRFLKGGRDGMGSCERIMGEVGPDFREEVGSYWA